MSKIAIDFKTGLIKKNEKIVVGIDLGTTYSLIAKIINGKPEIIKDSKGEVLYVPSVIYVDSHDQIHIGKTALTQLKTSPESTIYSIKRLMGKSFQDPVVKNEYLGYQISSGPSDNTLKVKLNKNYFTPVELSSFILKHLVQEASISLGVQISDAVITVPAYFNDDQRQATRDAGKLAGLNVLRIVNEPTAASLAYGIGLQSNENKTIAVYDLGGGTFDLSILRIEDGVFDVLATKGDTHLGGDDFDQLIIKYWQKQHASLETLNSTLMNELRMLAEKAKITVCNNVEFIKEWNNTILKLNTSEFDSISNTLVQKTIDCCKSALIDCKLNVGDIDEIILVGGSTRMPSIFQALEILFQKKPNISLHPDQAVALGAAIQADILSGNRNDLLLLDVIPLSLGIETLGGLMDIIIPRNSKIPINQVREYTTSKDGQVNLKISVYQGERDLVENNILLGEFILQNIPPMPAGIPKIRVNFQIDADGILKVIASEQRTNTQQEIVINSKVKLTPEEIATLLIDSVKNAKLDMEKKSLIDSINEGKSILSASTKFINSNLEFLKTDIIENIKELNRKLENAISTADKNSILACIENLNKYTTPLAHEALDRSIKKALTDNTTLTNIQKEI